MKIRLPSLRRIFYSLIFFTITLLVILFYITQILDPIRLLPIIKKEASRYGLQLEMGDLNWHFYPWFFLEATDLKLISEYGELKIDNVQGELSLKSLINDVLKFNSIIIKNPIINLKSKAFVETKKFSFINTFTIITQTMIGEVRIHNARVNGLPKGYTLSQIDIHGSELSAEKASSLKLIGNLSNHENAIPVSFKTKFSINKNLKSINFSNLIMGSNNFGINFHGNIKFDIYGNILGYASFDIPEFDLREWIESAGFDSVLPQNRQTFRHLLGKGNIIFKRKTGSITGVTMALDQTEIQGRIDFNLDPLIPQVQLQIATIDLSKYEIWSSQKNNPNRTKFNFPFLPGIYIISADELTVKQHKLKEVSADISIASDKKIKSKLLGSIEQGYFELNGLHTLKTQSYQLNGSMFKVPATSVLSNAKEGLVSGNFNLKFFKTDSKTFLASAKGTARFILNDIELNYLEIETKICSLYKQPLIRKKNIFNSSTIRLEVELRDGLSEIKSLETTLSDLEIRGNGILEIESGILTLNINILIPNNSKSFRCNFPEKLKRLSIPMLCRGQLKTGDKLNCQLKLSGINKYLSN